MLTEIKLRIKENISTHCKILFFKSLENILKIQLQNTKTQSKNVNFK